MTSKPPSWPSLYDPGVEVIHIPHQSAIQQEGFYLYRAIGSYPIHPVSSPGNFVASWLTSSQTYSDSHSTGPSFSTHPYLPSVDVTLSGTSTSPHLPSRIQSPILPLILVRMNSTDYPHPAVIHGIYVRSGSQSPTNVDLDSHLPCWCS
jgi:hypothetical protein